jgi:hypothetical protein
MSTHEARARFYVVFLYEGTYQQGAAEDIEEAEAKLDFCARQPGVIALGIYDLKEWDFCWKVTPALQEKHFPGVYQLSEKLKNKHDTQQDWPPTDLTQNQN